MLIIVFNVRFGILVFLIVLVVMLMNLMFVSKVFDLEFVKI